MTALLLCLVALIATSEPSTVPKAAVSCDALPPESRTPDPGSRIPDPGLRIPDPGSRTPDPGSWIPDSGPSNPHPTFPAAREDPITVSAAISLTDALEEIGRIFTAAGGAPVRFNFAGSNVLARQIANGAPVDVFISADEVQMQLVEDAGAIIPATRVDVVGNRLAVVTSPAKAGSIRDVHGLLHSDIARIAAGDPQAVPAGRYAKQYLESAGVWDQVSGKVVPVANVRAALAAVETGSADVAIVYESDAVTARHARLAFVVSGAKAPRIAYPAAVAKSSQKRAQAERFLQFLRGAQASEIFRRYKLMPLASTP